MENTDDNELYLMRVGDINLEIISLAEKYQGVHAYDMSVPENYSTAKAGKKELRKLINKIDERRLSITKPLREQVKKINAAGKDIIRRVEEIEKPITKALAEFDRQEERKKREAAQAEEKRINAIESRINDIMRLPSKCIRYDSITIEKTINYLKDEDPSSWADEFAHKASDRINSVLADLEILLEQKMELEKVKAREPEKAKKEVKTADLYKELLNAVPESSILTGESRHDAALRILKNSKK